HRPSPILISAPGEARECREILRESLAFARSAHHPLRDGAVLARSDQPYGPLLQDLCRARGWPQHLAMGRPALELVEQRLILLLLELAEEDFRRSKVIEFALLLPPTSAAAAEWDALSSEAGVVSGAGAWRDRLRACLHRFQMDQTVHDETKAATATRRLAVARALSAFIETLLTVVGRIPPQGRWSELTTSTAAAARALLPPSENLEACVSQLRELDALEEFQETIRREDFAAYVRRAFESAAAPEGAFQEAGPFVGDIMSARGVSWPMVIVPGLVEKTWPRQLREDPILLDDERRVLNDLCPAEDALPRLGEKLARGRDEERMLFRLACDAAIERLVITFPRLEPAAGKPRVPSVLLLETLGAANFTELEKRARIVPLVPMVPSEGELLDAHEYDHRLLATPHCRELAGGTPLLDAMLPTLAPGLMLEQTRWGGGGRFSRYDGCLQRQESLDLLRDLFDPAKRRWSISRLENYARSPFSFFLSEVLGVEELEEPDDLETISALDFGELYHRLLSNVIERFQMGNLLPIDPSRAVENEFVLSDEAEKVFAEFAARGKTGYPLMWRVKQAKTSADLLRWLRHEYGHAAKGFIPVAVEWAFGLSADPPPARIEADGGMTLLVAGQIDRVDMGPQDEVFVLDYKTGRPNTTRNASFCRARALQIPVYMLATEQLTGKSCGAGAYYFATRRGGFQKRGWVREELAAAEPRLREILGCLVRSILAGKFFITPDGTDAAGTAFTKAAVEALWEMRQDDETIADYRNATAADEPPAKDAKGE
ncbi:MAG: PD-(D/E)XK nuclease family protein, partial [Verrucomicrobiae bacterium]|nr:PD-(D/E)XK nuclease family protein [Verrucomicrobiae bacterium]